MQSSLTSLIVAAFKRNSAVKYTYDGLNFKKIKKICVEKVAGEQGLALQQLFP